MMDLTIWSPSPTLAVRCWCRMCCVEKEREGRRRRRGERKRARVRHHSFNLGQVRGVQTTPASLHMRRRERNANKDGAAPRQTETERAELEGSRRRHSIHGGADKAVSSARRDARK